MLDRRPKTHYWRIIKGILRDGWYVIPETIRATMTTSYESRGNELRLVLPKVGQKGQRVPIQFDRIF